jgi:transcriptional regulator with XRE-family HTH domain
MKYMDSSPQRWLRHYRQYHQMTIDDLAKAAGLSKVFVGKIERGERSPSPGSKQALADALGELVGDVFPSDGRMSPEEAAEYYVERIRSKKQGGVPESEYEQDMRAHGLDPDEEREGTEAVWFADDDTLVIDGRRFHEEIRAIHIQVPPIRATHNVPRSGNTRAKRSGAQRKSRATRSSSSDDPGEPHLVGFAASDPAAGELERAGAADGQPAAYRAARSRRAA